MATVQSLDLKTRGARKGASSPDAVSGRQPVPPVATALMERPGGVSVGAGRDDVVERGLAIYNSRLRQILEPGQAGKSVAIHIDSGDYLVEDYSGAAMRAMRKIHPTGQLLLHTIGVTSDAGIESRMSGSRVARS
jgi:hypothetical protein